MRREGRMHGSSVRVSKHDEWNGRKAPSKPTGHSRCTASCPGNKVRCFLCSSRPVTKSKEKIKGGLKKRAFNITRNYKMQEWRVCDSTPYSTSWRQFLTVEKDSLAASDVYADLEFTTDIEAAENSDYANEIQEETDFLEPGVSLTVSLLAGQEMNEVFPAFVCEDLAKSSNDSDDSWSGVYISHCEDVSDADENWVDDWIPVEEAL